MNPNSILGRYLSKQIILNFLGVLLMVLGVVFIFELIEMLRRAAGEDVGFLFVIQMAVTKLPQTIDMVFPFVMMIAAMITFWRLSKSNEFVIIRAAGVSIWGFLFPVLVTTFLIGIVNITVINPVSSKMYELYEKVNEETGEIIGGFTPKKDEKIIRIVPISPTEIKTKSIINKEDIETKYGIVTYNPNKPNKKGND